MFEPSSERRATAVRILDWLVRKATRGRVVLEAQRVLKVGTFIVIAFVLMTVLANVFSSLNGYDPTLYRDAPPHPGITRGGRFIYTSPSPSPSSRT